MNELPRVFVASSVEGLSVAEAVSIKLEYDAQVKLWDNAFSLSSITITSLIQRATDTDFGIFVFHPDDKPIITGNEYSAVRDNVLLELGLFIGALGIENCFLLMPKSAGSEFRLPSDLAGVTTTTYDDQLYNNMVDAVTTSCAKIKHAMKMNYASKTEVKEKKPDTGNQIIQQQLSSTQSEVWSLNHELQRAKDESHELLESIKSYFFSIAKPATEAEIVAWENGAKESYLKEVKVQRRSVYYVDKDLVIPPLFGASSISVIIAKGANVHGVGKQSHNTICYMDGFRKLGFM